MKDYVNLAQKNLAQKCAWLAAPREEPLFTANLGGAALPWQRVARMGASRAGVIAIA
jgi:hypothetical protein